MDVLTAIRRRREITRFLARPIPREVLDAVVESGYLAPTGNNLLSREFVVVQSRAMLDHLAGATPYVPWLKEAQAGIVVTGRPAVSKYWLHDAAIACAFLWLAAVEQGLGAAFGAIYHSEDAAESARRETYVRTALGIPDDRRVVAILGLGYPAAEPEPKTLPPREETIFFERFGGR